MLIFFLILIIVLFPQIVLIPSSYPEQVSLIKNRQVETTAFQKEGDIITFDLPKTLSTGPQKKRSESLGIVTTAKSALVIDKETGAVLFKKNVDEKLPIASLTKLMTALVFLDVMSDWNKKIELQKEDEKEGGIFYARAGEEVKVKDLFNMMLVGSVNNAAYALVRSTGLPQEEFVARMNEKAQMLGLNSTHFVDPAGLEPANVSTAVDIAMLLSYVLEEDEIQKAVIQKEYIFSPQNFQKTYYVKNTNELLWSFLNKEPYQIIGGKTGYLDEAKYNLALEVKKDGEEIIVVVLGSETIKDRFQEVKGLAVWAFDSYKW